ncbi:D-lactate dehydrogenase [Penicillium angulare]|uniref:D-lactate dehydrogenase n=1 Tax=Penicillium angulare TaxID=116970 RepID=UPI0025415083|nr:D-lactate dehydrogenase [Penicillium angulare]KAJ5257198.1 D-lactate dehydrogenase [Penicillium angulare]
MAANQLATVEAFLQGHPTIKFIPPSSTEFATAREVWNGSRPDTPLAIVQPHSSEDVATLIKFVKSNTISFSIRSGGHNLEGRALVQDALLIDIRALDSVTVADDRQSATLGGGILQGDVVKTLWSEGVATATGTIPHVGYFGWASYGGYGPFSSKWGLGVDQIIGATVVDPNGSLVKIGANNDLLKGIRGAGGVFGVIVDVTVRVYPAPSLLAGPIIFDTSDIAKSYTDINTAYNNLLDTETLPPQLTLQRVTFNSPRGLAFAFLFAWSGTADELEEGQKWSEKIASLGPAKMNMVKPTTIPEWISGAGAHVPRVVYGSSRTYNVSRITPKVAEAIGSNLAHLPADPGAMFSLHQLRGSSATPHIHTSVFEPREPHFMLEILGYSVTSEKQNDSEAWAEKFAAEVEEAASSSAVLLPTSYVSIYSSSHSVSTDEWVNRVYGDSARELRALKSSFDPENVFKYTVPSLE